MSGCQEEAAAISYGMDIMKHKVIEYIHNEFCKNCLTNKDCSVNCEFYKIKEFMESVK